MDLYYCFVKINMFLVFIICWMSSTYINLHAPPSPIRSTAALTVYCYTKEGAEGCGAKQRLNSHATVNFREIPTHIH
jgi:hypothetical protein